MWKKMLLLAPALALMAAANLRISCAVSVSGRELDGLYSPEAVARGMLVTELTAEELLEDEASPPLPEIRRRLGLRRPSGQVPELTDALLKATPGLGLTYGVYVNGQRLGSVTSEKALRRELGSFITNQLPTWAVSGDISESMSIRRQYSRPEKVTNTSDMVLLITGMAPVLYSDGNGYISLA